MKKLQVNNKYLGMTLVITIILILVFIFMPSRGAKLSAQNFPKKIGEYRLTNMQTLQKDSEINTILGQRISETFISNYIGPGANVTLWALVPVRSVKQTVIANTLAAAMSKKTDMFYSFSSITEGGYPVVIFTGPGESIHNYIFFKNAKVFWLMIESNGQVNERYVFKEFFAKF